MNVSEFKAFFKGLTATGTDGSLSPKQVSALIKAIEELKEEFPAFPPYVTPSDPPIVLYKLTC